MNGLPCKWFYTTERKAFRAIFKQLLRIILVSYIFDLFFVISTGSADAQLPPAWHHRHTQCCIPTGVFDRFWKNINIFLFHLSPCSTGRRCHCARMAYGKMNIYAVRSPRWFGGTSPALLFRMCFNCVSMANVWRTCCAYGAWMTMPLCMMSRMITWILRIHGASGVCMAYISSTRGDQLDSTAYGGRMYSAWAAYTRRTSKYTSFYSCGNVSKCLSCGCET